MLDKAEEGVEADSHYGTATQKKPDGTAVAEKARRGMISRCAADANAHDDRLHSKKFFLERKIAT